MPLEASPPPVSPAAAGQGRFALAVTLAIQIMAAWASLTGPVLGSFWRYRVGDYRIICDIQDGALCVLVLEIGNRKDVYR